MKYKLILLFLLLISLASSVEAIELTSSDYTVSPRGTFTLVVNIDSSSQSLQFDLDYDETYLTLVSVTQGSVVSGSFSHATQGDGEERILIYGSGSPGIDGAGDVTKFEFTASDATDQRVGISANDITTSGVTASNPISEVHIVCIPQTCASLGKDCGSYSDNCDGTLDCGPETQACDVSFGSCTISDGGTETCSDGTYGSCVTDTGTIDPRIATCSGKECGDDGCGGICTSTCGLNQQCSGASDPYQCVCISEYADCNENDGCETLLGTETNCLTCDDVCLGTTPICSATGCVGCEDDTDCLNGDVCNGDGSCSSETTLYVYPYIKIYDGVIPSSLDDSIINNDNPEIITIYDTLCENLSYSSPSNYVENMGIYRASSNLNMRVSSWYVNNNEPYSNYTDSNGGTWDGISSINCKGVSSDEIKAILITNKTVVSAGEEVIFTTSIITKNNIDITNGDTVVDISIDVDSDGTDEICSTCAQDIQAGYFAKAYYYDKAGIFTAKMTVIDSAGNTAEDEFEIEVLCTEDSHCQDGDELYCNTDTDDCVDQSQLPDLFIKQLTINSSQIVEGNPVTISTFIENNGGFDSGRFSMAIYMSSENDNDLTLTVPGTLLYTGESLGLLNDGTQENIEYNWTTPFNNNNDDNDIDICVYVDSTNSVNEKTESQNLLKIMVGGGNQMDNVGCIALTIHDGDDDGDGYIDDCDDNNVAVYQWLDGYTDADNDGYTVCDGDACLVSVCSGTTLPAGYQLDFSVDIDCNDGDNSINHGVAEVCDNGQDDNCDTFVDCADNDCASDSACVISYCGDGTCNGVENCETCETDCNVCAECTDSDGGKYPNVAGTIYGRDAAAGVSYSTKSDYCYSDINEENTLSCSGSTCGVREYFCLTSTEHPEGFIGAESILCPNGCEDGACLSGCMDSDGDLSIEEQYYVKGYTYFEDIKHDTCDEDNAGHLMEYTCQSKNDRGSDDYICPNGCEDGACLSGCTTDTDCDDGLFCNGVETCDASSVCQAGTAPDCDDSLDCTYDGCDETNDVCGYIVDNSICDDGLFCNGVETCDATLGCQDGTTVICDDNLDCTTSDVCDETKDSCAFDISGCTCETNADCDDSNQCTDDTCDLTTDTCTATNDDALTCDYSNPCTEYNVCLAGDCVGDAVDVDDGDSCTINSCNFINGISNTIINLCDGDGGDGCCPSSCNSNIDDDCLATCGNNVIEIDEECDGTDFGGRNCAFFRFTSGNLACNADCTVDTSNCVSVSVCGNNIIDAGEECDDGDIDNTDDCKNDCTLPTCGDGICSSGETSKNCVEDCGLCLCSDSDGGKDYYVLGETSGHIPDDSYDVVTDACLTSATEAINVSTSKYLGELYCVNDTHIDFEVYDCSTEGKVCVEGVCIEDNNLLYNLDINDTQNETQEESTSSSRGGTRFFIIETTYLAGCNDSKDNDGDGKIDYPADPGCESATDENEVDVVKSIPTTIKKVPITRTPVKTTPVTIIKKPAIPSAVCGNDICESTETPDSCSDDCKSSALIWYVLISTIIVAIILLAYKFKKSGTGLGFIHKTSTSPSQSTAFSSSSPTQPAQTSPNVQQQSIQQTATQQQFRQRFKQNVKRYAVDPRISMYVRNERKAGFSDQQIREVLLRKGWPQSKVDSAMTSG
jgi:hypothetical protein